MDGEIYFSQFKKQYEKRNDTNNYGKHGEWLRNMKIIVNIINLILKLLLIFIFLNPAILNIKAYLITYILN